MQPPAPGARPGDDAVADLQRKNARLEQKVLELTEQIVRLKAELHVAQARAAALTTVDDTTGLLNWRTFQERALLELARATRYERDTGLAVFAPDALDVDATSVRSFAETCQAQHRATDLSARGDLPSLEVVLLLPETTLQGVLVIAERIRAAQQRRHGWTVSGGCASWPAHGRGLPQLLAQARGALAAARAEGGDRVRAAALP